MSHDLQRGQALPAIAPLARVPRRCQSGGILQVNLPTTEADKPQHPGTRQDAVEWKSRFPRTSVTVLFQCQFSEMSRRLGETWAHGRAAQRLRGATLGLTGHAASPHSGSRGALLSGSRPTRAHGHAAPTRAHGRRSAAPRPHTRAHGRAAPAAPRRHTGLTGTLLPTHTRTAGAPLGDSPPHTRAHGRRSVTPPPHLGLTGAAPVTPPPHTLGAHERTAQ